MKFWILLSFAFFGGFSVTLSAQTVEICSDNSDWAPYSYYPRVNGKADKSRQIGITQDLLKEVFKIVGLKYSITPKPWKRCLREVHEFGRTKQFEAFIDGSFSEERVEKYHLSTTIYSTHPGVFYSTKTYPDGLPLKKPSDLNNFRICGVLGWNYEYFYQKYGVLRSKKIDQGAKTLEAALNKVAKGRCDVLENSIEPVYGGVAIGAITFPPGIKSMRLPGVDPLTFHVFIAKTSPRAYELLTKINQALLVIQHNGVSKSIIKKYLPDG
jgi:polar amino acid transport system substrate-binding protein